MWRTPELPPCRSASLPSLAPGARRCSALSGGAGDSGLESEPASGASGAPRAALSGGARCRPLTATIAQHYYLEGAWGWVVVLCHALLNVLLHGEQVSCGLLTALARAKFNQPGASAGWLGALSIALSWLLSPITIAVCRRKSTRLTAVLGALVSALGILFTSFASRFHQLFISYGTIFAIGVSMTRDSSTLMVGQYFKRRRELVETVVMSGSGVGLALMSAVTQTAIGWAGWRLGLQAVTGAMVLTFLLGTCYRSASLYHPQRRAILHLKHSKKKVKGKAKIDDRPPFFDFSMLRSRTVRVLLLSTSLSSVGLHTPLIFLAQQAEADGLGEHAVLLLQACLGAGWALGCCAFGFVVVRNNQECHISRQYLYQAASFVCGVCLLTLPAVHGQPGYVLFAWLYGIFYGGFQYSLKMCTYEKVRARNFAKTWGFVQGTQALPLLIGVPAAGYINLAAGSKAGYYLSAAFAVAGSLSVFLLEVQRRPGRHRRRHRHHQPQPPQPQPAPLPRADSLPDVDERVLNLLKQRASAIAASSGDQKHQELTCISEEGIADMDLPDALFEDIELELNMLQGDITSCNKVENYLMLSEYENNLIAEFPAERRPAGHRRSLQSRVRSATSAGRQQADIPEEKSDIESDLNSDASISSRLFRNLWRSKKKGASDTARTSQ